MQDRYPQEPGIHKVLLVMYASDSTACTTNPNGDSVWPVYLTFGNLPMRFRYRAQNRCFPPVGFLPHLDGTADLKVLEPNFFLITFIQDTDQFRYMKRKTFHECYEVMNRSLMEKSKYGFRSGSFIIHPVLWATMLDQPEAATNALVYSTR